MYCKSIVKKPKVLILDDSTSAVDTATDAKIRRAFREEIPDTTKLIIAQRISSVQDADRIIVMEDGKVNGFGTHEELLEQNDIYREVYESQTKGGGDFDENRKVSKMPRNGRQMQGQPSEGHGKNPGKNFRRLGLCICI